MERVFQIQSTEKRATLTSYLGESDEDLQFFGIVPDNLDKLEKSKDPVQGLVRPSPAIFFLRASVCQICNL